MVWVGFDDNQPLGLSGSQAALPIWTEFMKTALAGTAEHHASRCPTASPTRTSIATPASWRLPACPRTFTEAFLAGTEPTRVDCPLSHGVVAGNGLARSPARRPEAGSRKPRTGAYNQAHMNQEVFAALAEALEQGEEVALVTIVASTGSTPQRVGAKMLVYADGRTVGTIGGGCYENDAFWKAPRGHQPRKRPVNVRYELNDDFAQETGLVCGGQMEVFIEPVEASPEVYIFGAGHVGYCAARMAHEVGFRVHVVDDREKFANTERFGPGIDVMVGRHSGLAGGAAACRPRPTP